MIRSRRTSHFIKQLFRSMNILRLSNTHRFIWNGYMQMIRVRIALAEPLFIANNLHPNHISFPFLIYLLICLYSSWLFLLFSFRVISFFLPVTFTMWNGVPSYSLPIGSLTTSRSGDVFSTGARVRIATSHILPRLIVGADLEYCTLYYGSFRFFLVYCLCAPRQSQPVVGCCCANCT